MKGEKTELKSDEANCGTKPTCEERMFDNIQPPQIKIHTPDSHEEELDNTDFNNV